LVDIAEDYKQEKSALHDAGEADAVYSRLLTKKQLSDMAWGVRELSKKLGSLKLKLKVRTVFLLTKAHDETLIAHTRQVTEWLLSKDRDTPYIVYVENTLENNHLFDAKRLTAADASYEGRLKYWDSQLTARHPQTFDFVITLGGDGTVLYASWLFQRIVPPVLSFAMGSLGFLTKFDFEKFEDTLTGAFKDGVAVSLRLRFEGTIMRSQPRPDGATRDLVEELIGDELDDDHTHKPGRTFSILNDIVVDRGPNPSGFFSNSFDEITFH
jgi:NAD+ kinase